ncbi:MAG: SDR family oxidoreductase [Gammaproteobacteria bacterium]|nr:SDR family oxidoreductase [Gammaproteobacteria bacterium]
MQQVYIITGANGAVGAQLIQKLSLKDKKVIGLVRPNRNDLPLVDNPMCSYQSTEVTSYQAVHDTFEEISSEYEIVGVAHCVGSIILKPLSLVTPEEWQETIAVNLTSAFNIVSAVGKFVKQNASVVLFSSAAAKIGLANHEAIAAAKAGVEGLTRAAAASYATKNIRFNAIAPGLVESKMSKALFSNERIIKASEKMHALGRLGSPGKIASLAAWLLDPENDWITGEVIHCDGGLANIKLPL